jgi:hypothetical protein
MPNLTPNIITAAEPTTSGSNFSTVNLLQPTAFKITIDRQHYANLEFFAQSVLHPAMTLNAIEVPYQRVGSIPFAGDKLVFGEVSAIVIIDEDMNAYVEMYNWMKRLVETNQVNPLDRNDTNPTTFADVTVSVLSSHNNPTRSIKYVDCVPTLLGDVSFEATSGDIEYLTFPVSFRFSYFTIS